MLDIVQETYDGNRVPAMITERSEQDIKSKESSLQKVHFGDEF